MSTLTTLATAVLEKVRADEGFATLTHPAQAVRVRALLDQISEERKTYLPPHEQETLAREVCEHAIYPFRTLQKYIDDERTEEVMINPSGDVFIKERFNQKLTELKKAVTPTLVMEIIEKLLEGTGRRVDARNPTVDLHLPNGRANIVLPPLSPQGPAVTVRLFPKQPLTLTDLYDKKLFDAPLLKFLQQVVAHKCNLLIAGGTASGKTTLLSALLSQIAEHEPQTRMVIVEETAEIRLDSRLRNAVFLESSPKAGADHLSIRQLVKNALRMRPERLVIGEVRGAEAFDLLQAMNTGHPGSVCTIHANSALDALSRLEALTHLSQFSGLSGETIQRWISDAIEIVVFVVHLGSSRKITEVLWVENGKPQRLFHFDGKEFGANKKLVSRCIKMMQEKVR